MAICPLAHVELLPANSTQNHIDPTCTVWHSAAPGGQDLYGWWMNPNSQGLECHFYIASDGSIYQYMDTNVRADANVQANGYGISVETQNNPNNQFDADLWTKEQIDSAVKLQNWICDTHPKVLRQLCTDGRNGIGWHEQYAYWTTPGHHCPGNARVGQLRNIIIPAVQKGGALPEEDDLTPEQAAQLNDIVVRLARIEDLVIPAAIDGVYHAYLDRNPDPGGADFEWSDYRKNLSAQRLHDNVALSDEAKKKAGAK